MVSKTVYIRTHVQAQTVSGHAKRCVALPAARSVAVRVCAHCSKTRFAAGFALTAWSVARQHAKETGVCDSCELCCKKTEVCVLEVIQATEDHRCILQRYWGSCAFRRKTKNSPIRRVRSDNI